MRISLVGPATSKNCPLQSVRALLKDLHRPGFYGSTVFLEPEAGFDLVGVRIWAVGLQPHGIYIVHGFSDLCMLPHSFVLPLAWRWKYRSAKSAGSRASRLAGFLTRAHLAMSLSFPACEARRAIARLVAVSSAGGVEPKQLERAIHQLAPRHPKVLEGPFINDLCRALVNSDVWMIQSMGN